MFTWSKRTYHFFFRICDVTKKSIFTRPNQYWARDQGFSSACCELLCQWKSVVPTASRLLELSSLPKMDALFPKITLGVIFQTPSNTYKRTGILTMLSSVFVILNCVRSQESGGRVPQMVTLSTKFATVS